MGVERPWTMPAPHVPRPGDPFLARWIARHGEDTWRDLPLLPESDPVRAAIVLRDLVEHACAFTHLTAINLGRFGALAMPRPWVLANLQPILDDVLATGDDWDFRRALELVQLLGGADLLRALVERGLASADPEIRDAAGDFA